MTSRHFSGALCKFLCFCYNYYDLYVLLLLAFLFIWKKKCVPKGSMSFKVDRMRKASRQKADYAEPLWQSGHLLRKASRSQWTEPLLKQAGGEDGTQHWTVQ